MVNRGRDASDIFTATVGYGAGGKVRVGPLQVGALANRDVAGLRNSHCGIWTKASGSTDMMELDLFLLGDGCWFGGDVFDAGEGHNYNENENRSPYTCMMKPLPCLTVPVHGDFQIDKPHGRTWPMYTQVEVVAAAGPSLRLGFNPGELLDFILGWTTIDIFSDDLE